MTSGSLWLLLLFLGLQTLAAVRPSYYNAFKYEEETLYKGKPKTCYVHQYNFSVPAGTYDPLDDGEDMINYVPLASYKTRCIDASVARKMNLMRGLDDKFYLVLCTASRYSDGLKVHCDMFRETGAVAIADFDCPAVDGSGAKGAFYMGDYLTGRNPHGYTYGDAIVYYDVGGEPDAGCAKQRGFQSITGLVEEFDTSGYSSYDAFADAGFVYAGAHKRLIFDGRHHVVRSGEQSITYGDGQKAYVIKSRKDYDLFVNLDLGHGRIVLPKSDEDGLVGYIWFPESRWYDFETGKSIPVDKKTIAPKDTSIQWNRKEQKAYLQACENRNNVVQCYLWKDNEFVKDYELNVSACKQNEHTMFHFLHPSTHDPKSVSQELIGFHRFGRCHLNKDGSLRHYEPGRFQSIGHDPVRNELFGFYRNNFTLVPLDVYKQPFDYQNAFDHSKLYSYGRRVYSDSMQSRGFELKHKWFILDELTPEGNKLEPKFWKSKFEHLSGIVDRMLFHKLLGFQF